MNPLDVPHLGGLRHAYKRQAFPRSMPDKRAGLSRTSRGVQQWILAVLREAGPTTTLSTAKIAKRIAKSSEKRYHPNSVYTALRTLASQGAITATRAGNKKSYSISRGLREARSRPQVEPAPAPPDVVPGHAFPTEHASSPESIRLAAGLPHKLAPGEILIFPIRDGHVLVATNLHGRLVFERHVVPS